MKARFIYRRLQIAGRALALAAPVLLSLEARADERGADEARTDEWLHEISAGVLHHDTDNLWSGFRRESGVDANVEVLFPSLGKAFGGGLHPAVGVSVNSDGDTSKGYAGVRWRYEFESRFFAGIGLGAAVHDGERHLVSNDRKALGSRVLFHIPVEAGFRFDEHYSVSIYFDHVSNANLADENEGMDTLGIRAGYRF